MDKATPCFSKCLELAEEIFKHLNDQDLIKCSHINKIWYDTSEKIQWKRKIQKFSWLNYLHERTWSSILVQVPKEYLKIIARACEKHIDSIEKEQCSPLHVAACCKDFKLFECILEKFHHKSPEDKYGRTPFHIAANAGNFEVCEFYVKEDRNNPKDHHDWTPLHHAASSGQLDICKLIYESLSIGN